MARLCGGLKQKKDPWEKEQQVREHRVEEAAGTPEDACSGRGWSRGDLVTLGTIQVLHSHMVPRVLGGVDRGHFIVDGSVGQCWAKCGHEHSPPKGEGQGDHVCEALGTGYT